MSSSSNADLTNEQRRDFDEYYKLSDEQESNVGQYQQTMFIADKYVHPSGREAFIKKTLDEFDISKEKIQERQKKIQEIYTRIKPIIEERQKKLQEELQKKLRAEQEAREKRREQARQSSSQQQQSQPSRSRQTSTSCEELLKQYNITDKKSFKDFLLKYHPDKSGYSPGTKEYEEITEIFKKVYPCGETLPNSKGGKRKTRKNKRKISRKRR